MSRMPTLFIGHGSPMIALSENHFTRTWAALAHSLQRPQAILCISAHWLTPVSAVTAMQKPRTIHDFGAFPQALFDVRYPAPGDPALAARVANLLAPSPVILDRDEWGLDHGTWSVLCKAYPKADVPVVQLGMSAAASPAEHFELGRRLRPLREEGVLIIGTGNIVHNLRLMDWDHADIPAYDWSARFNDYVRRAIQNDEPEKIINFASQKEDAALSAPTPEHFWPLLYTLGMRGDGESAHILTDVIEHGSLSMMSVGLGLTPEQAMLRAAA